MALLKVAKFLTLTFYDLDHISHIKIIFKYTLPDANKKNLNVSIPTIIQGSQLKYRQNRIVEHAFSESGI